MEFDEVKYQIEEFFNGKFEVKKFLGEGAFAKVYLVYHKYLDTFMAMKIINEPLSITTNKKDVFHEVMLACRLRHRNIITIYDAAEISNLEDFQNHAYFLMEYVSGGNLERFLNSFSENNMFMPIERSLDLIRQILNGLNVLHCANPPIVHRDLKPNNVLLSFDASGDIITKISDFGFAKEITTSIRDIDIAGTRPYMAPELFNKNVSTKSDIYAVGVIFYQLLTNEYPYDIENYTTRELIDLKPWEKELKPPSHYNGNVFEDLDRIVLKCLDINANNRYFDAGDLLRDVEKAIDEYESSQVVCRSGIIDDYLDEYSDCIINDSIMHAFELAKHENKLKEAIEILEGQVLENYEIRKWYSEILRIWKSQHPDLKLISKAFTVNLKGKNYTMSCNLLKEAIAYNPALKGKYQHYIDLWEIFIDLKHHGNLFKSVSLLENLMDSSDEIKRLYTDILPILKSYSADEIAVQAIRLVNMNNLACGANLMEFAVAANSQIRQKYAYRMSLWKQNMKMHFTSPDEIKKDTIDYAIDLGTTDSVISYFNEGKPIIIKNHRTGDDVTPSAVMVDEEKNIEVGTNARDAIFENDPNAISEFKHNMGFSIPFKFEKSSVVMYPEELSAEVLKDLRFSVFDERKVSIEHAVICVPANSNPIKTKAINDAADLAGFRSHQLIMEPIAVAMAYDLNKDDGIWMIYDLGGGTFDVTLVRSINGEIEKIATEGMENLGGDAFDWKIVNDLFRPVISRDLGLDDFRRDNPKYLKIFARLKAAAEKMKKDLSKSITASICLDTLFDNYDFTYTLNREKFEQIIEPLMKYTFKLSRKLLDENSVSEDDIDKIVLAGGSSLSPAVRKSISNEFDIEIESSINPLTAVSLGAAIYAGSLEKPKAEPCDVSFSVLLTQKDNLIEGRVFSSDAKFSFLGYSIEFKNAEKSTLSQLNIDGEFKLALPGDSFDINIYNGDIPVELDVKSPIRFENEKIYIPYFDKAFELDCCNVSLNELYDEYHNLMGDIESLKDCSYEFDDLPLGYMERLIEVSKRYPAALNQASIYMDYMKDIAESLKRDLEFEILLENVLRKIEVVKISGLFDTEDIGEISDSRDLDKLKCYYSGLVERYVELNRDSVVEEVFYNLKFEGVYTNNEKLASELIEKAETALTQQRYDDLFSIVNLLYELDERIKYSKNGVIHEGF